MLMQEIGSLAAKATAAVTFSTIGIAAHAQVPKPDRWAVADPVPQMYPQAAITALSAIDDARTLLVGDSIAARWPQANAERWFGTRVVNLGYPKDTPESLL